MNTTPHRFTPCSPARRLFSLAAAMLITLISFSSVVSLADDQPMAIAGQSAHHQLARKADTAGLRVAAVSARHADQAPAN